MDAQLAARTAEPIGQTTGSLLVCRSLGVSARLLLLLPPLPLLHIIWHSAARPARVPGPDTDPLLLRVVEALRAPGRAPHPLQAGVEHVALVGELAGVDTVLTGAVGVTCREEGLNLV